MQRCSKSLIFHDGIRTQILGNKRGDGFVIRFSFPDEGGSFLIASSIVLWSGRVDSSYMASHVCCVAKVFYFSTTQLTYNVALVQFASAVDIVEAEVFPHIYF